MLLSAGGFAIYRAESNVFNLIVPRFRGLRSARDREELMKTWLKSKAFGLSGLEPVEIEQKIRANCKCGGDFLRIVMEEVARKQGVRRWADCTPDHLLYMEDIKREIPNALFIHIIRDGRDVALSYVKQRWSHPLPWDRNERLGVAALYWEWAVRKGRAQGTQLGGDYREVRFEELIAQPKQTLAELGSFIGHNLDYDRILAVGIGSISEPNSSFGSDLKAHFNPVGRWKINLSKDQIAALEALVGQFLLELGYAPASPLKNRKSFRAERLRKTYPFLLEAKQWMKATPLGRFVDLRNLGLNSSHR
jgi:hypothetical protein